MFVELSSIGLFLKPPMCRCTYSMSAVFQSGTAPIKHLPQSRQQHQMGRPTARPLVSARTRLEFIIDKSRSLCMVWHTPYLRTYEIYMLPLPGSRQPKNPPRPINTTFATQLAHAVTVNVADADTDARHATVPFLFRVDQKLSKLN